MRNSTDIRRSSDASLCDFVEHFAQFADTESSFVSAPFVLSPSTMGSFVGRRVSLKSDLISQHARGRSSISLPASNETKRLSTLVLENRSVQNSPRILPNQTLPPSTALPPIPAFSRLNGSSVSSNEFPVSPEPEAYKELKDTSVSEQTVKSETRPDSPPPLSTLQAIRALANSAPNLLEGPDVQEQDEEGSQYCEVKALRAALSYTLSRSDRLRASLAREQAEKRAALSELAVLRANVLSILGKSVFQAPRGNMLAGATRSETKDQTMTDFPTQDDNKAILTTVTRIQRQLPSQVTRQRKEAEEEKALPTTPSQSSPSTGSVSISSIRKGVTAHQGLGISMFDEVPQIEEESDADSLTDISEEKPKANISLTDFLNASRMSKTEIEERDGRFLSPSPLSGAGHWRDSTRSSSSLALEPEDTPAATPSSPGIGKFLRGISKKMEAERQRIMQSSSSRHSSNLVLGESSSNTRLIGKSSFSSLGRNSSVYSSLAPSTDTSQSYSTASISRRDKDRSSQNSAFSEGPAATRRVSRTPLFVESSIIPIQHIGHQGTQHGIATS